MPVIATNSGMMQTLYRECESEGKRVSTFYQETEDMVNELATDGWKSPAADQFYSEMRTRILESTRRLADALDATSVAISQINDVVVNADEEASDYLRGASSVS